LVAVVKSDGAPQIMGYGFGADRQACLAAVEAIKKIQSAAVIVRACNDTQSVILGRQ
jgi:hypothetical protein